MTTIISESPASLFNELIPVSLVSNGGRNKDVNCATEVNLKIGERRLENNEKELRIEISRPDEFEFLYADGITRHKYTTIAAAWHLNVDFEDFPKRIIRIVRDRDSPTCPVQLHCILSNDHNTCILELVRQIDVQTVKIAIELRKVTGEELMCHAMTTLRIFKKQLAKITNEKSVLETELEKKRKLEEEFSTYRDVVAAERSDHATRLQEAMAKIQQEVERREELENDLQIEIDAKNAANSAVDDLRSDVNLLEDKVLLLEEDLDLVDIEREELERKLESHKSRTRESERELTLLESELSDEKRKHNQTRANLHKAQEIIKKYLQKDMENPSVDVPSCDQRKLEELREDLKEKEGIIEKMTETLNATKRRVEELEKETNGLRKTVEEFVDKEVKRQQALDMYRNQQRITPPTIPNPATRMGYGVQPHYGSPIVPYQPVLGLGRSQTNTALATPLRNSPMGMGSRYSSPLTARENIVPRPPFAPPTQTQPNK